MPHAPAARRGRPARAAFAARDASHTAGPEQQVEPRIDDVERVAVEPAVRERHQQPEAVAVQEVEEDVRVQADERQQDELTERHVRRLALRSPAAGCRLPVLLAAGSWLPSAGA